VTAGRRLALGWSGLLAGPLAWAANTQAGQLLPYAECGAALPASALLSALALVVSLGGGALSWRVSGLRGGTGTPGLLGSLGLMMGLVVGFALLQGLSGLLVNPCAR
jgi:hypothetical protein